MREPSGLSKSLGSLVIRATALVLVNEEISSGFALLKIGLLCVHVGENRFPDRGQALKRSRVG